MIVTEFKRDHVRAAAEILAAMHQAVEAVGPTSVLDGTTAAQAALEAAFGAGPGVVAVDRGEVVGYMLMPLPNVPGPGDSRLRPVHHAARSSVRDAYRQMYAAVASRAVRAGCTYHSVPIAASASGVLQTFFELEFGVDQVKGALSIREVPERDARGGATRDAVPTDIDGLIDLSIELQKFHARAPIFHPALLPVPAIREDLLRSMSDPTSKVLVVDEGARVLGMMQAQPDGAYRESVVIGMNVVTEDARGRGLGTAMLNALLSWARDRGYRFCTVGWSSSNLTSDAFYRSRGFAPLRYRLHRRVDSRVAWANESLDYGEFPLR